MVILLARWKTRRPWRRRLIGLLLPARLSSLPRANFISLSNRPLASCRLDQYQAVKDLLESGGKVVGYLTGLSIYNTLGLTTQVGSTIQIGRNEVRSSFKRGRYTISFVKQKNSITKENIPLLQLLDGLRFIKNIPDSSVQNSCRILQNSISALSEQEQGTLVRLSVKYQPATRALLGAMLCELGKEAMAEKLKKSLNPLTSYIIPGISEELLSASRWGIK